MILHCLVMMALALHPGQSADYNCSAEYDRIPLDSDLWIDCGENMITVELNLCTAQWAGYNESNLAMNGQHNNSLCQGVTDTSVDPPVIRYQLPVNHSQENPCRQSMEIVNEAPGPGVFSQFLSVQAVIIKGYIDTPASDVGVISYATDLFYSFSCRYPLEYLLNNTQITSSSVSVVTSDNNGTFINTLSMSVYNDTDYMYPLVLPEAGLDLRTEVYVEVKATNLTGNFHVLLDHCFATPSPFNDSAGESHDFFIGCVVDLKAELKENGLGQSARFNFEAFRFVEHRDQKKSSMYVHCIVRLCEPSECEALLTSCIGRRRRRSLEPLGSETKDSATISAGPIYTNDYDAVERPLSSSNSGAESAATSNTNITGLVVGLIFASAGAVVLVLGAWFALKKFYFANGRPHSFN